ncbi:ABC transporter ATP-binding protein [Caproiciproducens sp. R2]|uniref:ABC transporter ATP-binding protein n=1 Tax=Caproiciproducens sp. R2 TaxID=3435187 RepID=UPI0040340EBE
MLKLAKYLKKYRKQVIVGPIFKLIEAIFELIVPIITAKMIDNGVRTGDVGYVWRMGGIMLLLGVTGLCSALICQKLASIASQGFGTVVRSELYKHINTFSHSEIDRFGTPSLITRMTNDINQLQYAVAMLIRLVIRAPFLAVGAIIMAMLVDLPLSVVFLTATPLIALVLYIIMTRSVPFFRVMQKKLDAISLVTREGLSGVRVIRAFSKQKSEEERFNAAADDQTATAIRVGKLSALLNPLTYTIMNFAVIAIVWFGGWRVDSGAMTQGEVIAFVNYMSQTLLAMIVVANLVVTFTKASASASRINEVFDTVSSVPEPVGAPVAPVPDTPKIQFQNVSFSYDGPDKYAVKNLDFSIMPGETVGIIGGTGSGKSTLLNLIPRFYDVSSGKILIDGVNVREYPFSALRGQIGMVPQETVLFSGTIESNLRFGYRDATQEEMERALKIAQAYEFVSALPQGLQSPVNQGGKNFSGGQKQRLTIARALVGGPRILILDDSASALDFATDAALRKSIQRETSGMTVLMVSQRASTIRRADKIIVLDDGEIAGIGTHEQLMESCQVYQEICLSQLSRDEVSKK